MKKFLLLLATALLVTAAASSNLYAARAGDRLYNNSFEKTRELSSDEKIAAYEKTGWKFRRPVVFPKTWGPNPATGGKGSTLEVVTGGAHMGSRFIRIGGGGHVGSAYGKIKQGKPYVLTLWVRGQGDLWTGVYRYAGPPTEFINTQSILSVNVDTKEWVQYRGLFLNDDPNVYCVNPMLSATGLKPVDIDDVDFAPATPGEVAVVGEMSKLYGTGALIENLNVVRADDVFAKRRAEYKSALKDFRTKATGLDQELAQSLDREITALEPYLFAKNLTVVQTVYYNGMIAMTRVLKRLTRSPVKAPVPVQAKAVSAPVIDHKPGVRKPRPEAVTITRLRSDKVRYDENEQARTQATIVNTTGQAITGTLIARMTVELDTTRPLARTSFTIGAGQTRKWSFSYNVGPETYGRAIEVEFVGKDGKRLDRWQEYYAVAAEYFRVHQQTAAGPNKLYKVDPWVTYYTLQHFHCNEPSDAGLREFDAEVIISGQAGYRINQAARQARIDYSKRFGIQSTFYQRAFCGQMGYEAVRQHPEHALYDENGQFAVDPIYGGYPNPMELASPLEVGPKRKTMTIKPYLDRLYTPWQHVIGNWALEDTVVVQANRVKAYAKQRHFGGVYVDGNMGVGKGYAHDGKPNVPGGAPEEFARLNARNHKLFSEILKADDPNFGTWYNWGYDTRLVWLIMGLTQNYGSGFKDDVNDASIRTALSYQNVMVLDENQHILTSKRGKGTCSYPAKLLTKLIAQRDFVVQKYGGNTLIGYNFISIPYEDPGVSKWAWPTVNYFTAQLIATQQHHAGGFYPSYRPGLQFMTRYSRFLWARDIKAVPVADVEKQIQLQSPEKFWWKRLVYKRKTNEGHDLIVHFVRIPPTEQWDINWADEPAPLEGVTISAEIGSGHLSEVLSARPYHYEEEQQPVQKVLEAIVKGSQVTVQVPPFRYHTMVVFRIGDK